MLKQQSFLKEIFYTVRLATKSNKKSLYSAVYTIPSLNLLVSLFWYEEKTHFLAKYHLNCKELII